MKRGDRRGVALIFVLLLLVLLGVIVSEVVSQARMEAGILSSLRSRTVARYSAESGILAATIRIEALLDSTRSLPERITVLRDLNARLTSLNDVDLGSGRFGVAVVDLNARIDLNRADAATLQGLLQQFTTDQRAEEVVTLLKQAPLQRLGELAHIPGIDDSLALAVAPYVTVWSDGSVNINSAPEPVLAALPGVSSTMARSVVRRRETGEVFMTTSDLLGPPAGPPSQVPGVAAPRLTATPSRLLIVGRGWQDGHPLTHEIQAVYALAGTRLVLLSWQERDL
jgi:general secretion pathway protein K